MNDNLYRIVSSILFIAISYGIVFLIGNSFEQVNFSESFIYKSWGIIFLIQIIGFIPSFLFKTDHYFDITGGITFLVILFLATQKIINDEPLTLKLTPFFLSSIWAIRLSSFLFLRVKKAGKDIRFDNLKTNFFKFMLSWVVQGFWVFMCLLPLLVISDTKKSNNYIFLLIGIMIWSFGFIFEIISDNQKSSFNSNKNNKGNFIKTGLWSLSRHPNYFGEFILWIGITIIALPYFSGIHYITCLSPAFIYLMLNKISGVNLLEEIGDQRWGDEKSYLDYKKQTPVFFPKLSNLWTKKK